jgi:hypothetical protein
MANTYYATILQRPSQRPPDGLTWDVRVDYKVSASEVRQVWHGDVFLSNGEIQPIYDGPGTKLARKKLIEDLVKAKALLIGVDATDEALMAIDDLFPPATAYPDQITIRGV